MRDFVKTVKLKEWNQRRGFENLKSIVSFLTENRATEIRTKELVEAVNLRRPTVTKHLHTLAKKKIIWRHHKGLYRINLYKLWEYYCELFHPNWARWVNVLAKPLGKTKLGWNAFGDPDRHLISSCAIIDPQIVKRSFPLENISKMNNFVLEVCFKHVFKSKAQLKGKSGKAIFVFIVNPKALFKKPFEKYIIQ